uniref:Uncharacterized protein n=1 Tax=Arundo donax TaxID=35708 RepID=A0A0A8YE88_ARUDO
MRPSIFHHSAIFTCLIQIGCLGILINIRAGD